jgi:hypothetical protein
VKKSQFVCIAAAFGFAFAANAQQKIVVGSDAYPPAADPAKFHKVAGYSPYA